jgi:hypothetical protein
LPYSIGEFIGAGQPSVFVLWTLCKSIGQIIPEAVLGHVLLIAAFPDIFKQKTFFAQLGDANRQRIKRYRVHVDCAKRDILLLRSLIRSLELSGISRMAVSFALNARLDSQEVVHEIRTTLDEFHLPYDSLTIEDTIDRICVDPLVNVHLL